VDITQLEILFPSGEMSPVHLHFVFINVIGPYNPPAGLFESHAHEPDSGKEFRHGALIVHCVPKSCVVPSVPVCSQLITPKTRGNFPHRPSSRTL